MNKIKDFILNIGPIHFVITQYKKISFNAPMLIMTIVIALFAGNLLHNWYNEYIVLYNEANAKTEENKEEEKGLEFTKIDDNLYTLIGSVRKGDCERIVPHMPKSFTVILESPGGSLDEGSCLSAHLKLRDVVTVVRGDDVLNENGKVIYSPGAVTTDNDNVQDFMQGKTMCASACGLLFLAGDKRYLIGDVYFGIHGPGTPMESITKMHPKALEASAYRTAGALLKLLERLDVNEKLRLLFIQIPNASMYWLKPGDFAAKPELVTIATNYKDFWDFSASNLEAGLK